MSQSSPMAKRKRDYMQLERQRCICCYAEWSLSSFFYQVDETQTKSLSRSNSISTVSPELLQALAAENEANNTTANSSTTATSGSPAPVANLSHSGSTASPNSVVNDSITDSPKRNTGGPPLGLLRGSSASKSAKTIAAAKAAVAARQSIAQSRELSQNDLANLIDHAKAKDVDRWVNGRPLLLPIVNAGPLLRVSNGGDSDEEPVAVSSPGLAPRSSANATPTAVPTAFEELPAKRSSTVLERSQKTGPYIHSGLVNLSPISPHAKFAESTTRSKSRLFSSSKKTKQGWDGLERVCTKHYHQNEELVEHLLRGARDGVCVCCQLATTKSPTFYQLRADNTLPATEDIAQVERDAALAASSASSGGSKKRSGSSKKTAKKASSPAPGSPALTSSAPPAIDAPNSRAPLVLPMPRGDRPVAPTEPQLCASHWERNKAVVTDSRLIDDGVAHDEDLVFESSCCLIPHPQKQKSEDAFFIAASSRALGVCDGVGGWASLGVDPSAYSTRLTKEMRAYVDRGGNPGAHEVLHHGWVVTQAARVQGSTTACVLTLDRDNFVNTINVGDSGFLVIRDSYLVYASDPQQHAPNTPFQLGTDSVDTPHDGVVARLKLRIGDLIVVGSDGLFDNLYTDDIVALVNEGGSIEVIANRLSTAASSRANNGEYLSPFATYIRALGKYPDWTGGKLDDITSIVARVGKMGKEARVAQQERLLTVMQNMLGGEQSQALDCEVCGFKFKTPDLRRLHIAQWHAESVAPQPLLPAGDNGTGNSSTDSDDNNRTGGDDDDDDGDDDGKPKAKSKAKTSAPSPSKQGVVHDDDDDTRTCDSDDEWSNDEEGAKGTTVGKKKQATNGSSAPAAPGTPTPAVAGPARVPFSQRVIAVPMWPVTGGSEKSYVEFQRAQAELELWENGVLRERLTAEQYRRQAALRDASSSGSEVESPQPAMINNAIAGMMQRRMQRPQSLRSEYVILPYSWSTIFN